MRQANMTFLDNAIESGKRIFFSHDPTDVRNLTGGFLEEVKHLSSKNFEFKAVGDNLWEAVKKN